jgi:hypothetical protein
MTSNYQAEDQGKKLFGTSVLFFSQGLTWFGLDLPGGIFTLRPLNTFDAFFRAEIVIGGHRGSVRNAFMAERIS